MHQPRADDRVSLSEGLPELQLSREMIGIVRSVWFAPACAYEVEFHGEAENETVWVLVTSEQVHCVAG